MIRDEPAWRYTTAVVEVSFDGPEPTLEDVADGDRVVGHEPRSRTVGCLLGGSSSAKRTVPSQKGLDVRLLPEHAGMRRASRRCRGTPLSPAPVDRRHGPSGLRPRRTIFTCPPDHMSRDICPAAELATWRRTDHERRLRRDPIGLQFGAGSGELTEPLERTQASAELAGRTAAGRLRLVG